MDDPDKLIAMVDASLAGTVIPEPGKPRKRRVRQPAQSRWDDPATRARVEKARVRTYFGGPGRTPCSKPGCKNPVTRDYDRCFNHLTGPERGAVRRRNQANGGPAASKPAAARKLLQKMILGGQLPPALAMDPTFCALLAARKTTKRVNGQTHNLQEPADQRTFGTMSWNQAVYLVAAEMIRGYALREKGDWGPWTDAIMKVRAMGIVP